MNDTLYSAIRRTALKHPGKCCIVFYGKRLSYQKFLKYVDTFSGNLKRQGFKAGDVITVCLPNSPSAAVAFYAINKLGAICNLVHPFTPAEQLKHVLEQTDSKLLIIYDIYTQKNGVVDFGIATYLSRSSFFMNGVVRMIFNIQQKVAKNSYQNLEKMFLTGDTDQQFHQFSDTQPSVFLPSGGTTGEPKIIMHNCEAFNFVCKNAQFFVKDQLSTYKAMYSVLPIFHGFGLCMNLHLSLYHAITVVMSMKFNVREVTRLVNREKVGIAMGVPAMFKRMLDDKKFCRTRFATLRECFVGGDTVSEQLIEEFNSTLAANGSQARLLCGYGLAETVSVCVVNTVNDHKDGSLGKPLPQTEFCILKDEQVVSDNSEGEILVSCPMLMLGYFKSSYNPTIELNGKKWLKTGDYGFVDSDGFLHYKQRVKNIIKINGVPVFPSEIEKITNTVEKVSNCCAIGIEDKIRGQAVKLFVEAAPDVDRQKLQAEIVQLLKKRVISYAVPREIVFVEQLPLNNIGKIDRKQLSATEVSNN